MSERETLYTMACDCAALRYDKECLYSFGDIACGNCRSYIGNYSQAGMQELKLFMYGAENDIALLKYRLKYHSSSSVALREGWSSLKNLIKVALTLGAIALAGYYSFRALVHYVYRGI